LISVFIIIGYLLCYFNDINKDSSTSKQNTNIKQIDFNPSSKNYDKNFLNKIQEEFDKNKKVNINNIEQKLGLYKDNLQENEIIKSTVNIAFTLDPGYLLETMLTITSMIISQKDSTKLMPKAFDISRLADISKKNSLIMILSIRLSEVVRVTTQMLLCLLWFRNIKAVLLLSQVLGISWEVAI
jgi:hypothetical protein